MKQAIVVWVSLGIGFAMGQSKQIQGPKGDQGVQGPKGETGIMGPMGHSGADTRLDPLG